MEENNEQRNRPERRPASAAVRERPRTPADGPRRPRAAGVSTAERSRERSRRMAERETGERRPPVAAVEDRRETGTAERRSTPSRRPSEGASRSGAAGAPRRTQQTPPRGRETPEEETAPQQAPRREARHAPARKKKRRPHRIRNTNFWFKFLTMLAVVAAVILGLVIFFKVQKIEVVGNEYYTPDQIIENSGVHIDDNLLSLSKASVSANIHKTLHYVEEVQIKKKLPGTVIIIVKESHVTYGIQDRTGSWWLIDKSCKVLDSIDAQSVKSHTVVKGMQIQPPELGQQIKPAASDGADLAELSAKEQALQTLLPLLEESPLAQKIASVDLSASYDIILMYETRYEFKLGNTERLEYKLQFMRGILEKPEIQNGAWSIDLSFNMSDNPIASPR